MEEPITHQLWHSLIELDHQVKALLLKMTAASELSSSATWVIFRLEMVEQMTMNEVAEYLGITLGGTTSLVNKLEDEGFLKRDRDQADRRIIHVRMTELGRAKLYELRAVFREQAVSLFSTVDPRSLEREARP